MDTVPMLKYLALLQIIKNARIACGDTGDENTWNALYVSSNLRPDHPDFRK